MALNAKRSWIIAYDISDPKRLGRVYRLMLKRGIPQQRSVFRATITTSEARKLLAELAALIDSVADDVRLYPLPATPEIIRLGNGGRDISGHVLVE